ncbi:MAG: hypothetical protein RL685_6038 [Pseudomonadota bacterium]|jgi:hypothetical protein
MFKSHVRPLQALVLMAGVQLACSKPQEPAGSNPAPAAAAATVPSPAALPPIDQQLIAERLGTTAQALEGGAVAVTLLREGVAQSVEGTPLTSALRTELTFRPAAEGAALSGSVELLEDEVSPVIDTLLAHGVRAIGLYSRYLYDQPRVLALRFEGEGNPALLASGAQSISAVLRDARLRSAKPLAALPGDAPVRGKLDAAALGGVLGVQASALGDAVLLELPRPPSAAAPTNAAAPTIAPHPLLRARFSGSDLAAALDGTFVLTAQELNPVLAKLRTANVHPVGIVPRGAEAGSDWYSLHVRGKGTSLSLIRALAQALAARVPQQ